MWTAQSIYTKRKRKRKKEIKQYRTLLPAKSSTSNSNLEISGGIKADFQPIYISHHTMVLYIRCGNHYI